MGAIDPEGGKVLLVLESVGDGGTEVYVEGLAAYLSAFYPVEILVLNGDAALAAARFPGQRVRAVEGARALTTACRGAVLVNLHLYSNLLPAVRAVRQARVPVVVTLHMPLAPWNALHRARWRLAVAGTAGAVGVSEHCFAGFGPMMWGKPRRVVSGPLPLDAFPPAARPRALEGRPLEVVCAARLSPEKDLPTLIRAAASAANLRLTLIGEGPLRSELGALARSLGVSVTFAGHMPRDAVFEAVRAADVFVLPSRFEGLGMAAVEAMALGVPTVTSDFPAAREYLVPGETGLPFPRGDANALASALDRLHADLSLRTRLSTAGAAAIRRTFSPDVQFGRYIDLFRELRVTGAMPAAAA